MSYPTFQVQIAFASTPLANPQVWTDITQYVRNIQCGRGRQHVLDHFQPGQLTITLNNRDRRFDPTNIYSPYYPQVNINKQIQVNISSGGSNTLWKGFIDTITPMWPDNLNSDVVVNATDALRILNSNNVTSLYALQGILADGPKQFYPCYDTFGTTSAYDAVTLTNNGLIQTFIASAVYQPGIFAFGQAGMNPADSNTALGMSQTTSLLPTGFANLPHNTSGYSYELCFKTSIIPTTSYGISFGQTAGINAQTVSSGKLQVTWKGDGQTVTSNAAVNDGRFHHLAITAAVTGTDAIGTITVYLDGAAIGTISGGSYAEVGVRPPYFGADQAAGTGGGPTTTDSVIQWCAYWTTTVLSAAQVLNHFTYVSAGFAVEDSGSRITKVLLDAGWPTAWETIATGNSNVQTPTSSLATTSVLSYMQQCELAEHGYLFANHAGNIIFINRQALMTTPYTVSQGTWGDLPSTEIAYQQNPTFALDDIDLYNIATVTRTGGVPQTASNTASQTQYGVNAALVESGLLVTTDAEAFARAQFDVSYFSQPITRVRQITYDVIADLSGNALAQAYTRDLMDRITVNRRPWSSSASSTGPGFGGPTFTQDYFIEGLQHNIDPESGTWTVTYMLDPQGTQQSPWWILNTSALDGSRLPAPGAVMDSWALDVDALDGGSNAAPAAILAY